MKPPKLSNGVTWQTNTPVMSRLDCIATQMYCVYILANDRTKAMQYAVADAQLLIAELDKVQAQEAKP